MFSRGSNSFGIIYIRIFHHGEICDQTLQVLLPVSKQPSNSKDGLDIAYDIVITGA